MNIQNWAPTDLSLSSDQLKLWNAVVSYAGVPIPVNGKHTSLRFEISDRPQSGKWVIPAQLPNGRICLVTIDHFPFNSLFNVDLTIEQVEALSDPIRQALIDGMIAALINGLPSEIETQVQTSAGFSIDEFMKREASDTLTWLQVTIEGMSADHALIKVGCTPGDLCQFLDGKEIHAHPVWGQLKTKITTSVERLVGLAQFSLADMQRLETGDIVLMETDYMSQTALLANNHVYQFTQHEDGWLCEAAVQAVANLIPPRRYNESSLPMSNVETDKSDELENAQQASNEGTSETSDNFPPGLPEVEENVFENKMPRESEVGAKTVDLALSTIPLSFDLGQTEISIAEIESWQTGSIVSLNDGLTGNTARVSIRSQGKLIGEGELVKIDERAAVRISKVFLSD